MPQSNTPEVRDRNFSDVEAHAFIALLRRKAGWRDSDISDTEMVRSWGVKPHRIQPLIDEADRLVTNIMDKQ